MTYATLADARRCLKAIDTDDDPVLLSNLRIVTRRVNAMMDGGWGFEPKLYSKAFVLVQERVNSTQRTFHFDGRMLELTAVTVGNKSLTLTTEVLAWPYYQYPFSWLYLPDETDTWWSLNTGSDLPVLVTVMGYWGVHTDYDNAWQSLDSVQNATGITASATSVTVTDADGTGWHGETPRLSAGNLIKIGTEFMRVLATNTSTNVLTIRRAENGTTAAIHAKSAAISVWYPEDDIRQVVARQAAAMYARRGAFEQRAMLGDGVYDYPPDLLPELRNVVTGYWYS